MSTTALFQISAYGLSLRSMDSNTKKGDKAFAARISEAIKYSGRSQRQIAMDVGVSPQSVTKWLRYGYMDRKNVPNFCRACGVSIEWFLTGEGDPEAPNPLRDASDSEVIQAATRLSNRGRAALLGQLADLIAQGQDSQRSK